MKKLIPILLMLFIVLTAFQCEEDIEIDEITELMIDIDGNSYETVKIGNQIWTRENLRTTTLNDGTPLTEWVFPADWHNANTPIAHYQFAGTDDLNNVYSEPLPDNYYGCLYNHFALETGKIAPQGWRIPTVADFRELESYLGTLGYSGQEATVLKSNIGWMPFIGNGTDEVSFRGLPNGYSSALGTSTLGEGIATFATTDVDTASGMRVLVQLSEEPEMLILENALQIGPGIRLIKE